MDGLLGVERSMLGEYIVLSINKGRARIDPRAFPALSFFVAAPSEQPGCKGHLRCQVDVA